jgi:predicted phage gp36 major capsid-like protein
MPSRYCSATSAAVTFLVDLVGFRITVDEVTTPGYVKWYLRRRVGGIVLDNYAIKAGKCVAA